MKNKLSLLAALFILPLTINAQEDVKEAKWDVAKPGESFNYKKQNFTTSEGTWMNLDVSPDGKTIVFDMLGDIYSMPISGGKAKVLRSGIPFEIQPRFSPDGKFISFTSDAGGGDNIWVMKIDGTDVRQITKEDFRLVNNAAWMPNGNYIVGKKHFSSQRSLGAGEMWQYHISGGSGNQLTKRKNDQQDVNEPVISHDGKFMYYSEDVYPGGYFQYNKDPNNQIFVINRYDFETGEIERITGGPGGAARPQISRDGKLLAFVKRIREKTVLYLHDLETGEEWPLYDKLDKDQQTAWTLFGVYPNFSWMPSNDAIIFWAGGHIQKIDIKSLTVTQIPFTVDVAIDVADRVHFNTPISDDDFNVKMIRDAVTSPDGKTIIFRALGYLWKKTLPNGTPKRLTNGSDFEAEPTFTFDGKNIVFVSWNDVNLGAICKVGLNGKKIVKLTSEKGIFRTPNISPDGKMLTYLKEEGNSDQGYAFSKKSGIYTMNISGGNTKFVSPEGEYPVFSKDGKRIFYQTGGVFFGNLTKELKSSDLNGKDERTHIKSKNANRLVPSPDNEWIAFTMLHKGYVAPLIMNGQTLDLDSSSTAVPVAEITEIAGINLHWSPDSKKIMYTLGDTYYNSALKDRYTFLENSPEKVDKQTDAGIKIGLTSKVDKSKGRIALTNTRIITMNGDKVIENGTLIINQNRIESVGSSNDIKIPSDALVYDLTNKTIMPGMVDAHAHIGAFRYGLTTQKNWQLYANLAFGVTTSHDPSSNTESIFTLSEMVKSGALVGPRIFSTGYILYGAEGDFKAVINKLDDARSSVKRTKAFGALSVKSYNQPRREQRQQILQAAREEGINVVPEGGSTFFTNMTMIIDGHTGIEHNIPITPVYKDVIELWSKSNVGYTPTLIVNYGGLNAELYWYERTNVWENKKLLQFTPQGIIDSRSRYRMMAPEEDYQNDHILTSKTVKTLADSGVKINMGAHGQLQGMGAHWELWSINQGGMTNLETLKTATINSANYIGAGKDIGSLEAGKLADILVLDENPLVDIQNSNTIRYTIANGRIYESATMNEIGNQPKERTNFYWENSKYNAAFPWHEESNSFSEQHCCGALHN